MLVPMALAGGSVSLNMKMFGDRSKAFLPDATARSGDSPMTSGDDRKRFGIIVAPHLGDGYALARWITGRPADAEDVVQDASLRAFRSIRSVSGEGARAWFLTIVRNTAYTWLRKNRPAALVTVDDLEKVEQATADPVHPDVRTPESELIAATDAAPLSAAIAALPVPFRETVVLRDVQGLDYREIAAVTGVPVGTVMSRLARGRARLLAVLGGRGR